VCPRESQPVGDALLQDRGQVLALDQFHHPPQEVVAVVAVGPLLAGSATGGNLASMVNSCSTVRFDVRAARQRGVRLKCAARRETAGGEVSAAVWWE
jgi:hypothetical protein